MLRFNRLPDDRAVGRCPAQNRSAVLDLLGGDVSAHEMAAQDRTTEVHRGAAGGSPR